MFNAMGQFSVCYLLYMPFRGMFLVMYFFFCAFCFFWLLPGFLFSLCFLITGYIHSSSGSHFYFYRGVGAGGGLVLRYECVSRWEVGGWRYVFFLCVIIIVWGCSLGNRGYVGCLVSYLLGS